PRRFATDANPARRDTKSAQLDGKLVRRNWFPLPSPFGPRPAFYFGQQFCQPSRWNPVRAFIRKDFGDVTEQQGAHAVRVQIISARVFGKCLGTASRPVSTRSFC